MPYSPGANDEAIKLCASHIVGLQPAVGGWMQTMGGADGAQAARRLGGRRRLLQH